MGRYPHFSPFTALKAEDLKSVRRALQLTGMQTFANRALSTLSGGEQQKVMIAAALAQAARIMLLDEPAAFLDPYQQDQIYRLLEIIHQETNLTIVEVTHDINRAALGHERILGLRQGKVVFWGTPDELMTPAVLFEIYKKRFQLAPHPENGHTIVFPEVTTCSCTKKLL